MVKLTDVGLAKHLNDIAGTKCGSPCYMAPEVLNGRMYGQEADVYSFAIILWEMWYGLDAAEHLSSQLYGSFEKSIDGGFRPSLSLKTPPIDEWKKLIMASWNKDPSCRPTAERIMKFCDDFLHFPPVDY